MIIFVKFIDFVAFDFKITTIEPDIDKAGN